jgi:hypothetical protein
MDVIGGTTGVVAGISLIVFSRWLARGTVDQQNRIFGFRPVEDQLLPTQLAWIIAGIVLIFAGLSTLVGKLP